MATGCGSSSTWSSGTGSSSTARTRTRSPGSRCEGDANPLGEGRRPVAPQRGRTAAELSHPLRALAATPRVHPDDARARRRPARTAGAADAIRVNRIAAVRRAQATQRPLRGRAGTLVVLAAAGQPLEVAYPGTPPRRRARPRRARLRSVCRRLPLRRAEPAPAVAGAGRALRAQRGVPDLEAPESDLPPLEPEEGASGGRSGATKPAPAR